MIGEKRQAEPGLRVSRTLVTNGFDPNASLSADAFRGARFPTAIAEGLEEDIVQSAKAARSSVKATVQRLACQAAGHEDVFFEGAKQDGKAHPDTIYKKRDDKERANYTAMFAEEDSFQRVAPTYYGDLDGELDGAEAESSDAKAEEAQFIVIENLLAEFTVPFVMDCKLGIRSYEEKECESKKGREDLYKRLNKIGPEYLTEDDHKKGSITKHKWMSTRDAMSTLQSMGIRIDGIVGPDGLFVHADYFANIAERAIMLKEVKQFLDHLPSRKAVDGDSESATAEVPQERHHHSDVEVRRQLAALIQERVIEVRTNCQNSPFFASHEFVGVSLLIIIEAPPPFFKPQARAAMIDFAKTSRVPEGITLTHVKPWSLGNHEDGILLGLENCIACWKDVEAEYVAELRELQAAVSTQAFVNGRQVDESEAEAMANRAEEQAKSLTQDGDNKVVPVPRSPPKIEGSTERGPCCFNLWR